MNFNPVKVGLVLQCKGLISEIATTIKLRYIPKHLVENFNNIYNF